MAWTERVMASLSGSPATRQCTVSRMISGGSAGLMTMMALPFWAPPTFSMAPAVVRVNSSMFLRVPGPAERLDTVATISPYATGCTRLTAATMGMVAWPPQVTMFTFISALPTCSFRLTGGTQNGPMAAGVRSIMSAPCAFTLREFSACT
uniref:Acetaldehyde dehydrogenase n=1 Tax=Diaphorobacter sp. PCA039 TaxID=266831 RepID=C0KGM7_9BURK|nr:acetaldehyde dehydrogenase [Diaphorobacter sp. PCA039]